MLSTQKHSTGLIGQIATKICCGCKKELPLDCFYRHSGRKDGLRSNCKICKKAAVRKWKEENIFYTYNQNAKDRARKKGVEFNLTGNYLKSIDRDVCPYFKIPIKFYPLGRGRGNTPVDSKSLDRIRPELGYVEGNVVWCSQGANQLLSNYTAETLMSIPLLYQVGHNFMRLLNSTKPTEHETTQAAS